MQGNVGQAALQFMDANAALNNAAAGAETMRQARTNELNQFTNTFGQDQGVMSLSKQHGISDMLVQLTALVAPAKCFEEPLPHVLPVTAEGIAEYKAGLVDAIKDFATSLRSNEDRKNALIRLAKKLQPEVDSDPQTNVVLDPPNNFYPANARIRPSDSLERGLLCQVYAFWVVREESATIEVSAVRSVIATTAAFAYEMRGSQKTQVMMRAKAMSSEINTRRAIAKELTRDAANTGFKLAGSKHARDEEDFFAEIGFKHAPDNSDDAEPKKQIERETQQQSTKKTNNKKNQQQGNNNNRSSSNGNSGNRGTPPGLRGEALNAPLLPTPGVPSRRLTKDDFTGSYAKFFKDLPEDMKMLNRAHEAAAWIKKHKM